MLDQSTERPYLVPGLVTAAGIGILGAVEAYLGARRRTPPLATLQVPSVLGARIETLAVRRGPGGVDVQLFRLRF